uniref:Uncharacterized protein n=1 Tax=Cacopsylla melanoneura TaxID=428564 RepID=A0A8D8Y0K1_9HEMI
MQEGAAGTPAHASLNVVTADLRRDCVVIQRPLHASGMTGWGTPITHCSGWVEEFAVHVGAIALQEILARDRVLEPAPCTVLTMSTRIVFTNSICSCYALNVRSALTV